MTVVRDVALVDKLGLGTVLETAVRDDPKLLLADGEPDPTTVYALDV